MENEKTLLENEIEELKVKNQQLKIEIDNLWYCINNNLKPDENLSLPVQIEDLKLIQLLETPISECDFSINIIKCMGAQNITTIGQMYSLSKKDLLKFRNFGKKTLSELEEFATYKGLTFGYKNKFLGNSFYNKTS